MSGRAIRLLLSAALAVAGSLMLVAPGAGQDEAGIAYSIELTGTIDPATEQWLGQALDDAAEQDADVAIVRIDTPGGLDSSTREMVQDIIDAPMPVIVYVTPDGARAASAGLFITMSADVAAIAPSEQTLLEQLDGFRIRGPKAQELDTEGLEIEQRDMPFQYQLLQIIVN